MARKEITLAVPQWTANLIPNLFGLASLAAVCVAVGLLTDYRWAILAAGVFGVLLTAWVQWSATPEVAAKPTPLKKAA